MDAMKHRYRARVHLSMDLIVAASSSEEADAEVHKIAATRAGIRAHIDAISVSPLSLAESLREDNLAQWQESEAVLLGTDDQRSRWGAGVLPSEELLELARPVLFSAFAAFAKHNRIPVSAIPHPRDGRGSWTCAQSGQAHGVSLQIPIAWSTDVSPAIGVAEWRALKLLNLAIEATNRHPWLACAPSGASVVTRVHRGVCQRCRQSASATCALVTIAWAGRVVSREYRL